MTDELLRNRDGNDRHISATTGAPIVPVYVDPATVPERPEYGAPLPPSEVTPTRLDRKQALTREQWEDFLDSTRPQFLAGYATFATEVAHTVRDLLRELEVESAGTPVDRLRNLARVFAASEDRDVRLAGKFVEIAILALEDGAARLTPEPLAPRQGATR